jgi:hypothetical protein
MNVEISPENSFTEVEAYFARKMRIQHGIEYDMQNICPVNTEPLRDGRRHFESMLRIIPNGRNRTISIT